MTKQISFVVMAILFSSGVSYWLGTQSHTHTEKQDFPEISALEAKIRELESNELKRLSESSDSDEKLRLANEALSKIMNIFLLDLGIRANPKTVKNLQQALAPSTDRATIVATTPAPQIESQVQLSTSPAHKSTTSDETKATAKPDINDVRNDEDLKNFLEKSQLTDLASAWKSGSLPSLEQLALINGRFGGYSQMKDPAEPPWDMRITVRGRLESGKLGGRFSSRLSKNGRVFSSTSGNGTDLKDIKAGPDGSILLDVQGGRGYLQMFYFPQMNSFRGNIYQQKDMGEFNWTGSFTLNKD